MNLLSLAEAADVLEIPRSKMFDWLSTVISSVTTDGSRYVSIESLRAFANQQQDEAIKEMWLKRLDEWEQKARTLRLSGEGATPCQKGHSS